MPEHFNWDGSPKDERLAGFSPARNMWLHKSNRSTSLPGNNLVRCRYCGLRMQYFDRWDHGRIPMVPKMLPSAAVPVPMRWNVMSGIALPGDDGAGRCFVPHPAFCPAVKHENADLRLAEARAVFRRRMERRIAEEGFIPDLPPAGEEDVAEQHIEPVEGRRHIVAYARLLWLAPGRIDTIQCVALARTTGERCKNTISQDEGVWEEVEIPYPPGRAGQQVLWAGTTMWAYALHALHTDEFNRWMRQRCMQHAPGGNAAPDAVSSQWVRFDALRHEEFILRERPANAQQVLLDRRLDRIATGPERTECATSDCRNGTVSKVPKGWACWKCARTVKRRTRTHRKWISGDRQDEQ
ncbi:DUF6083 domain-containing protein [Streptomyces misionensis]|uniref:DUF6083 domain-containing protein n=1 Tax=Streptomyces misionensis TaxID=67331 RepID=UPI0038124C46